MKFPLLMLAVGMLGGSGLGYWLGGKAVAKDLIEAAASADGMEGGARIRHAAIGNITNVLIAPDHVAIFGTEGSRQWWP